MLSNSSLKPKGFTLLELLIVIGILAILGTTTILVINPAQMLAEARDTQRISDLRAVQSAISLYLTNVPDGIFHATGRACTGSSVWRASGAGTPRAAISAANCPFSGSAPASASLPSSGFRNIDGTGWVSLSTSNGFSDIPGGSPFAVMPEDPRPNNAAMKASGDLGRFYAFKCGGSTGDAARQYEINANMESVRYSNGGTSDVESTDGGGEAHIYEIGNDPGLDLTCI